MLVLINRTKNILCVIIQIGKLMTHNNNNINTLPSCYENKNIFTRPAKTTMKGKQFAILEWQEAESFIKVLFPTNCDWHVTIITFTPFKNILDCATFSSQ